jgi:hypothetical protein
MTHQDRQRQTTRHFNATEKEELDGKIGFIGCVTPSEATSIKVSAFMRNSRLHGLGLPLDGESHTWADSKLRYKIRRHRAEIYTPGIEVTYEFDKIKSLTQMRGLPPHFWIPYVKMEGSYLHSFKVCYPNSIQYRSRCIERQQDKQDKPGWNPGALEALFSFLLPVEVESH